MNESPPKKTLAPLPVASPVSPEGVTNDGFKKTKSPPSEQRAAGAAGILSESTNSMGGLSPLPGISAPSEPAGDATALEQTVSMQARGLGSAVKCTEPSPPTDGLDNTVAKPKRPPPKLSSTRPKPGSVKFMTTKNAQDSDADDGGGKNDVAASDELDNTVAKPKRPPPKFLSGRSKPGSTKSQSPKKDTDTPGVDTNNDDSTPDTVDNVMAKPKRPPPKLSSAQPKPGSVEPTIEESTAAYVEPKGSSDVLCDNASKPIQLSPKLSSSQLSGTVTTTITGENSDGKVSKHQSDSPDRSSGLYGYED